MNIEAAATPFEVELQEEPGSSKRISIRVSPGHMEAVRNRERNALARKVKLKGFRKGKVPVKVMEDRYASSIDENTLQALIDEGFRAGMQDLDVRVVGQPRVENVDYQRGQRLAFDVVVEIMPEVELARIGGFRVTRPEVVVTEEDVDAILERLRTDEAVLEPVDREVEDGDVVSVRIRPVGDSGDEAEARPYRFEIGAGYAIPGVEDAIRTLSPGGSGEFAVTYPEDFDSEELAGSTRTLRIELLEVKARRLPELNDEFATTIGDFDTLEALTAAIREDIEASKEREAQQAVHERLLDMVVEANPFEVPPGLVSSYLDRVIDAPEDADPERLAAARQSIQPAVERQIRRDLVLRRLIETHELEASEEEVDERLEKLAEAQSLQPGEVRQRLAREKRLDALRSQIETDKAFDLLLNESTVE